MTDVDIWTYRETGVGDIDLTGFKVEAQDGDIGKIDEATYEAGSAYLVVDTGPWIFGKKVLLPAGTVQRVDVEDERVYVDRTKDEIKNAPEFDPDEFSRDDTYRREIGDYYGAGAGIGAGTMGAGAGTTGGTMGAGTTGAGTTGGTTAGGTDTGYDTDTRY